MTSIKPLPAIAVICAVCICLGFLIPGLVKAILALLTALAIWGAVECFRDRDFVPGVIFGAASLIIGFLTVVSQ